MESNSEIPYNEYCSKPIELNEEQLEIINKIRNELDLSKEEYRDRDIRRYKKTQANIK